MDESVSSLLLPSMWDASRHRPPGETRGFFSEDDSESLQKKDTDISRSSKERTSLSPSRPRTGRP